MNLTLSGLHDHKFVWSRLQGFCVHTCINYINGCCNWLELHYLYNKTPRLSLSMLNHHFDVVSIPGPYVPWPVLKPQCQLRIFHRFWSSLLYARSVTECPRCDIGFFLLLFCHCSHPDRYSGLSFTSNFLSTPVRPQFSIVRWYCIHSYISFILTDSRLFYSRLTRLFHSKKWLNVIGTCLNCTSIQ
jgi:hypothetical protein